MTEPSIDELFAETLTGNYDDDAPCEAVRKLHHLGTREVFERAVEWCGSSDSQRRARGADILAQLQKTNEQPRTAFAEETYAVVSGLAQRERDPLPLASAITALGHLQDPRALPLMIEKRMHPAESVRLAVAFALGTSFPDEATSIKALTVLMEDPDGSVRDWATFGLGVLGSSDSAEIREALWKRMVDSDPDARGEALVGLSKRKDVRAVPALIAALNRDEVSVHATEAAAYFLDASDADRNWGPQDYAQALRSRFGSTENSSS